MLGRRNAEFTFYFIWPLLAKASFPHLQNVFAIRTYFAQSCVSYCYDSLCPCCSHFNNDLGCVIFSYSIVKPRKTLTSPGEGGIVKIKSEVRVPLSADLYVYELKQ